MSCGAVRCGAVRCFIGKHLSLARKVPCNVFIPHGNSGRWRAQLLAPWPAYQEGCGRARLPTAATRAA